MHLFSRMNLEMNILILNNNNESHPKLIKVKVVKILNILKINYLKLANKICFTSKSM